MFKLPKDGSGDYIAAKAAVWGSAYEGNIGLTCGLGKKSLCAKKGTIVDLGGKDRSLQGKIKTQIDTNNWKEYMNKKWK
jgi:hypothetical protein